MGNERITEDIVRQHFKSDSMFADVKMEEQISTIPRVNKLLCGASKCGLGKGRPEFIITVNDNPDFVIIVECKADILDHESKTRNNYSKYAVDGALLYSSYLSKDFDVLSIAVSGQTKDELKVSYFLQHKNKSEVEQIFGNKLISISDIIAGITQNKQVRQEKYENLLDYSKTLNSILHNLKIKEDKRSLLLSGILIALKNKDFYRDYASINSPKILASTLVGTIKEQLSNENLQGEKIEKLMHNYEFINTHPSLVEPKVKEELKSLKELIDDIDENINGYARTYKYFDVLGQFYIEFLRYSNSDKGLGIVLTPPHITEFFTDIVDIKPTDVVYDNCTGTAGFLVSSMKKMVERANGDKELEKRIKLEQLFGVEFQPEIYPLAVSNMFLHGDGKSNIIASSCFDITTINTIKSKNPTKGFLNPPYKSDKKDDIEELEFVLNSLECLKEHGECVAIIPMSCVLAQKGERLRLKEKLLAKHTLKAVFSMPNELFFNSKVGTNTCIVVLEAHVPHSSKKSTFFGYFKNDGFTKRKAKGRFDYFGKWKDIKEEWLDLYYNNQEKAGISVIKKVTAGDEWCAEAYMKTDYDLLNQDDFEKTIKDYCIYLLANNMKSDITSDSITSSIEPLNTTRWQEFKIHSNELFKVTGSRTTPPLDLLELKSGQYPYVTTQATNNGVSGKYNYFTEQGNVITVDSAVIGYASYQQEKFLASDHVEKLQPHFDMNQYVAMFLVTVLNKEQYRYNYGRKASQARLKVSNIKLPVNENGAPDWNFMESYIKSLPYSKNL